MAANSYLSLLLIVLTMQKGITVSRQVKLNCWIKYNVNGRIIPETHLTWQTIKSDDIPK